MSKNKITLIFLLITTLLFLNGCRDNIILPDAVNQLQAPGLLYPPDDTINVDIPMTFSWEGNGNIKDYVLQISTDSLFNISAHIHRARKTIIKDVTGLDNRTKYYWRVQSIDKYGMAQWSTTWNFTTGKFCNEIPAVDYYGKIYKTVQIGNQCWLRENLDVGIRINWRTGQLDNEIIEKYCYNDSIENCNKYGGLYYWNEAVNYDTAQGAQGICPEGWHIPTLEEYQTLNANVDGSANALKTIGQGTDDGAGTNTSGFSVIFGGYQKLFGDFFAMGKETWFWSSTRRIWSPYVMSLVYNYDYIYIDPSEYRSVGLSIRCIKN